MSLAQTSALDELPGTNCGVCGFRTCGALAEQLEKRPDLIKRCITRSANQIQTPVVSQSKARPIAFGSA